MPEAYSEKEIWRALEKLPGWSFHDGALEREFELKSFLEAMKMVNRVAAIAEEVSHHPDITIRYNRVGFRLWSHDAHGVTARDLALAARIGELV